MQRSGIQVNASATQIAATSKEQQTTAVEIAATTTQIGATSNEISATSRELVKTMNDVSGVAAQTAQHMGMKPVAHIKGGFSEWKKSGAPVEEPVAKKP